MTTPEKPKSSLHKGISLRPRRYIEFTCPLPLKACHEKLNANFPGITTWNDSVDVVRFGYFSLVDDHEAARATGYLKALTDNTTLLSASVAIVAGWLWVMVKKHRHYGYDYLFNIVCLGYFIILLSLCAYMTYTLTAPPDSVTMLSQGMFFCVPVFLLAGVFGTGLLIDYIILTRYRDDLVTAIQDGLPAQHQAKKS